MLVTVDLDWTMEAVMNLMKNCMEHNHGGTVHCSYAQNPLYTEIQIWTMGKDLQKRIFPICLNGFTGGKTHVRAALESGWLCQRR